MVISAKLIAVLVALCVLGALWIGGELHRKNCLSEGHSGCSVLPWVAGNVQVWEERLPYDPVDRQRTLYAIEKQLGPLAASKALKYTEQLEAQEAKKP